MLLSLLPSPSLKSFTSSTIIYAYTFTLPAPLSPPPASHLARCSSVNVICHASVKHTLISLALWVESDPLCYSWPCHPSCLWSISYDALVIGAFVSLFQSPCVFAPSMHRQKGNTRDWCRGIFRVSKGKARIRGREDIDKPCNKLDVIASASSPRKQLRWMREVCYEVACKESPLIGSITHMRQG